VLFFLPSVFDRRTVHVLADAGWLDVIAVSNGIQTCDVIHNTPHGACHATLTLAPSSFRLRVNLYSCVNGARVVRR
jgi:hypothetical protein